MPLVRRDLLRSLAVALIPAHAGRTTAAETGPSHRMRLVVGFPAGGPMDIAARTIAPWLTDRLGQPVDVVNQPGGSGNLATRAVVQAEPDRQTLLLCGPVNTINTTLFPGSDFDFERGNGP